MFSVLMVPHVSFVAVANMRAGLNLPQWNPRTVPSNAVHRPVAIPAAWNTFDSKPSLTQQLKSSVVSFLYIKCFAFFPICHAPCTSASADYLTMWLMFFAEGWTYTKWLQKQKEWNLCRHLGAHFGWDLRWGGMGQRLWRYTEVEKTAPFLWQNSVQIGLGKGSHELQWLRDQ